MRGGTLGAAALFLAAAHTASAQSFPPVGPEFQVNVPAAADQFDPAIAAESDRGYVVVWRSGSSILGRRFDAGGIPVGAEFTANVLPVSAGAPAVGARSEGGFLVAWQAPDGDGDGIFARLFDAGGQPVGGEIAVNSAIAAGQSRPRVAAGRRGYVVLWTSGPSCVPPFCGGVQLRARLFDASATPIREIAVGNAIDADVVMTPPGFVVAWSQGSLVRAQLFDAAGNPGVIAVVAFVELGPQITARPMARIAADAHGAFTVSWWLYRYFIIKGAPPMSITADHGTFIRRYDAAGSPLGPELQANVHNPGFQNQGSLAMSPGGRLFSVWTSDPQPACNTPGCAPPPPPQDGSGAGVYARFFDALGNDSGELPIHTTTAGNQTHPAVAAAGESSALVVWQGASGIFGRRFGFLADRTRLEVDFAAHSQANGNGVLEPGERAVVAPAWRNLSGAAQALSSFALLTGPAGPLYETPDNYSFFGLVAHGATASCRNTGDCFVVAASGTRPAPHWDAELAEQVAPTARFTGLRVRSIHVGDSFANVPRTSAFSRFVETVFHNGVMGGCMPGLFCPFVAVPREEMALFVLKALQPPFVPPACVAGAERFADVPASSTYCPWIEELARRGVVAGCGGGNYCPQGSVTREAMAVYLLVTREGTGYAPPACTTPLFSDVPASSPFCRWIEELARRGSWAAAEAGGTVPPDWSRATRCRCS